MSASALLAGMGELRAASRWHAPPGPRRSRLPRGRALTWVCSVGLLLLFGLRGLLLGPGGVWQRMFGRLRTHPSLLLQHYNARQLLFRRDGKRVYFLHIHKVRPAPHGPRGMPSLSAARRRPAARCASWRWTPASW